MREHIETLLQDLRYGFRMLARGPGFTLVAVSSIALAIGVNCTIFTWMKAVVLDPLPTVKEQARLLTFSGVRGESHGGSHAYSDYLFYRDQNSVFSTLIAYELFELNLVDRGTPQLMFGSNVSTNYFDGLGLNPVLGRKFVADDEKPGASPVALISYQLWQQRFGGDATIVNRSVSLNGRVFTVIGVTPRGFSGAYGGIATDVWVPLVTWEKTGANVSRVPVEIMGRLKPGVSPSQAQADIHVLAQRLVQSNLKTAGWDVRLYPYTEFQRGIESSLAEVVPVLMAMTGLILLIACANLANLLLARSTARSKEMGVRLALGARRLRVVRQLMTESLMLAILGGGAGFLFAAWATKVGARFTAGIGFPLGFDLSLDHRVLGFAAGVVLLTSVLFGLIPALHSANPAIVASIKDQAGIFGAKHDRRRVRNILATAQVALSVVALIMAGLFLRSLHRTLNVDPGFNPNRVLLVSFNLSLNNYEAARGQQFYRQLLERVQALPGVQRTSITSYAPIGNSGGDNSRKVAIRGYIPRKDEYMGIVVDDVGPNYLHTMQIPLAAGRDFGWQDQEKSAPVAIINKTMAQRFWPDTDPVGKHIEVSGAAREIIGVAHDIEYRFPGDPPQPRMYLASLQDYEARQTLVVRTDGEPQQMTHSVQDVVKAIDPNVPVMEAITFDGHIRQHFFEGRLMASLLTVFATLALALAAIGLYGVISYFVAQRTRELGVRLALGAQRSDILGLVLSQGLLVTAVGALIGGVGGFALARLVSSMLFRVRPADPATFLLVGCVVACIALVATYIPARRAASIDPMAALRCE